MRLHLAPARSLARFSIPYLLVVAEHAFLRSTAFECSIVLFLVQRTIGPPKRCERVLQKQSPEWAGPLPKSVFNLPKICNVSPNRVQRHPQCKMWPKYVWGAHVVCRSCCVGPFRGLSSQHWRIQAAANCIFVTSSDQVQLASSVRSVAACIPHKCNRIHHRSFMRPSKTWQ